MIPIWSPPILVLLPQAAAMACATALWLALGGPGR